MRDHDVKSSLHAGFTLVELLVVIAILAILAAILLPVVVRMRAHSNAVICASNLRQIGCAVRMYANAFHDRYPDAYTVGGAFFRRGPGERNPADPTSVPETYGLPAVLSDLGYLPFNAAVWTCPAASDDFKRYKNTYMNALLVRSMSGITSGIRGSSRNRNLFYVEDDVGNLPYLTGVRRGLTDPNPVVPLSQQSYPHSYQTKWHAAGADPNSRRGSINALFVDGSVSIIQFVVNPANPSGPPMTIFAR